MTTHPLDETPLFAKTLEQFVEAEFNAALATLRDDWGLHDPIRVTAYRRGKCTTCNQHAERSRTFTRPGRDPIAEMRDVMAEAREWERGDVRHARCERVDGRAS